MNEGAYRQSEARKPVIYIYYGIPRNVVEHAVFHKRIVVWILFPAVTSHIQSSFPNNSALQILIIPYPAAKIREQSYTFRTFWCWWYFLLFKLKSSFGKKAHRLTSINKRIEISQENNPVHGITEAEEIGSFHASPFDHCWWKGVRIWRHLSRFIHEIFTAEHAGIRVRCPCQWSVVRICAIRSYRLTDTVHGSRITTLGELCGE